MNKYTPRNYYLQNKQKMIDASKQAYHRRIKNMTQDELLDFRKEKSEYFRQWYMRKRGISRVRERTVKATKATKSIKVIKEKIPETTEKVFNFSD